jgi:Flp pilus assembly protein TadB
MAKAKKQEEKLSPEEIEKQKREQERKEKEDKERKELEAKRAEKEKKAKLREERKKKQEKAEVKRIKRVIEFPFKTLFQVCLLLSVLFFVVQFFGIEIELYRSVFNAFMMFVALYLGFGLVMVAIFFVVAEDKTKKYEAIIKENEEKAKLEEEQKQAELEKMESEIRKNEKRKREELNQAPITEISAFDITEDMAEQKELNEHSDIDEPKLLDEPDIKDFNFEDLNQLQTDEQTLEPVEEKK